VRRTWPGIVDEHVLGLDVFVDQTALMDVAERRRQVNGEAEEAGVIDALRRRNS
jgi:hypothetical protein